MTAISSSTLYGKGWFQNKGVYAIVDGQYGSTGKGLAAHWLAREFSSLINCVTTNAGPNSGHTTYIDGKKVVLKQLPTSSVVLAAQGHLVHTLLNAGAVLDLDTLMAEIEAHKEAALRLVISPNAAVIRREHDHDLNRDIASTGKGVGPAMARKINRSPHATVGQLAQKTDLVPRKIRERIVYEAASPYWLSRCIMEVAQGFSLGINQRFYPYCTSRECTVSQALADLGAPPSAHRKTLMTLRTYPIRVGSLPEGTSGGHYNDQKELQWEDIGQPPELTTVTGRVRRLFSWSSRQVRDAMRANDPSVVYLNFCNYCTEKEVADRIDDIKAAADFVRREPLDAILLGWGPTVDDIEIIEG